LDSVVLALSRTDEGCAGCGNRLCTKGTSLAVP
jgi:hypothetical protein